MRERVWRSLLSYTAVLLAWGWMLGVAGWLLPTWQARAAVDRVELARDQAHCAFRLVSPANQARCREIVRMDHSSHIARVYFEDGLIVLGPGLLLLAGAFALRRGARPPALRDRSVRDRPLSPGPVPRPGVSTA